MARLLLAICLLIVACAPGPPGAEAPVNREAAVTELASCPDGEVTGRVNDLADNVYDTAVATYLLENTSGVGRTITPTSAEYAWTLLEDNDAYRKCVTIPQSCLRAWLRAATDMQEVSDILTTQGAEAHRQARECLQQAGDLWAARADKPVGRDSEEHLEGYRTIILPHLVGNIIPVGLHRSPGEKMRAREAWQNCYRALAESPLDPERLAERVSHDLTAPLDCPGANSPG